MTKPSINVTPLIDVLLVLLIIFMVVSPMRPERFRTHVPQEPRPNDREVEHPDTLLVRINDRLELSLNETSGLGTTEDSSKLTDSIRRILDKREANGAYTEAGRINRTVFVEAPVRAPYGAVVKAVDAIKLGGAEPVGLKIDQDGHGDSVNRP